MGEGGSNSKRSVKRKRKEGGTTSEKTPETHWGSHFCLQNSTLSGLDSSPHCCSLISCTESLAEKCWIVAQKTSLTLVPAPHFEEHWRGGQWRLMRMKG